MTKELAEWTTGRLLMTAARLVQHAWEDVLHSHSLSHAGFTILQCLQEGPMPQRALARDCRVTDQTISRSIERLEAHGLISRCTDPADERRQIVTITEAGRGVHAAVSERAEASRIVSGTVRDVDRLRADLIALIAGLDGLEANGRSGTSALTVHGGRSPAARGA